MFFNRSLITLGVAIPLLLTGCTATRFIYAKLQSKAHFYPCTSDARIRCEPGSEQLASKIEPLLDDGIRTVEHKLGSRFREPVIVYTYATLDTFAAHSGSPYGASGAVIDASLNLSPKLLGSPERVQRILTHELAHLHMRQQMNLLMWSRTPAWFHEGLATYVSNGGGAENISAESAMAALAIGKHFMAEPSRSLVSSPSSSSFGLEIHMFYRQAEIFVRFMHDRDNIAFEHLITSLENNVPFPDATEASYGMPVSALWRAFLETVKALPASQ